MKMKLISTKRKTNRKSNEDGSFITNGKVNLTVEYQLKDINAKIKRTNKRLIYGINEEFWKVIREQNCFPSEADITYVGIYESGNPISSSSSSNNNYTAKLFNLLSNTASMYKPPVNSHISNKKVDNFDLLLFSKTLH
jgi:hypothetical protein